MLIARQQNDTPDKMRRGHYKRRGSPVSYGSLPAESAGLAYSYPSTVAGKLARLAELYTLDNKDDIKRYLNDHQDLLAPLIEIHPLIAECPEVTGIRLEHCEYEQGDWEQLHISIATSIGDIGDRFSFKDKLRVKTMWRYPGKIQQRVLLSTDYENFQDS